MRFHWTFRIPQLIWLLLLTLAGNFMVVVRELPAQSPKIVQREKNTYLNSNWALSRKGNLLISSSTTGTIPHVWNNGKFVTSTQQVDRTAHDLMCFSDDGDVFLVSSSPNISEQNRSLRNETAIDQASPFQAKAPSDKNIANSRSSRARRGPAPTSQPCEVKLYRNSSKTSLTPFATIEARTSIAWLAISDDGSRVALFDPESKSIEIVNVIEGFNTPNKRLEDILYPTRVFDMTLSATGGHLLLAQEMRLTLIDTVSGKLIQSMSLDENWKQLRFSYGGRYLIAKRIDGEPKAIVMEVKTGKVLEFPIEAADQVHLTPDGQWLVRLTKTNLEFQKLSDRNQVYSELLHDDCNVNSQIIFSADFGRAVIWSDEPPRMYVAEFPFVTK